MFLLTMWTPAFGTIVHIQIAPGRIVIAADSRVRPDGITWYSDEYCKVIELDPRTIFYASGGVGVINKKTKKYAFTFVSTAREVFKKHAHDNIGTLAKIWREEALRHLLGEKTEPRQDFANASFVRSDTQGLRRIEIVFSSNSKGEITAREPRFDVLSLSTEEWLGNAQAGPLAFEFLNNQTPRAKEANRAFQIRVMELTHIERARQYEALRLESAIQAAMEWMPDKTSIGGQVDSVVLRQNGTVDWITKKDCSTPK